MERKERAGAEREAEFIGRNRRKRSGYVKSSDFEESQSRVAKYRLYLVHFDIAVK